TSPDDVPNTPPPSYNEVVHSHLQRVHSEPEPSIAYHPEPSAPSLQPDPQINRTDRLCEPRLSPAANQMIQNYNNNRGPDPQINRTDRLCEPRLSPAANQMIQNYNNSGPDNDKPYKPRFPHKDSPGG